MPHNTTQCNDPSTTRHRWVSRCARARAVCHNGERADGSGTRHEGDLALPGAAVARHHEPQRHAFHQAHVGQATCRVCVPGVRVGCVSCSVTPRRCQLPQQAAGGGSDCGARESRALQIDGLGGLGRLAAATAGGGSGRGGGRTIVPLASALLLFIVVVVLLLFTFFVLFALVLPRVGLLGAGGGGRLPLLAAGGVGGRVVDDVPPLRETLQRLRKVRRRQELGIRLNARTHAHIAHGARELRGGGM